MDRQRGRGGLAPGGVSGVRRQSHPNESRSNNNYLPTLSVRQDLLGGLLLSCFLDIFFVSCSVLTLDSKCVSFDFNSW